MPYCVCMAVVLHSELFSAGVVAVMIDGSEVQARVRTSCPSDVVALIGIAKVDARHDHGRATEHDWCK